MKAPAQPKKSRWITIYGVVAAFLLLALLITRFSSTGNETPGALRADTLQRAEAIAIGCDNYASKYGSLPSTSENAVLIKTLTQDNPQHLEFIIWKPSLMDDAGAAIDAGGTPYRITFDSDSKIHIVAAGPDKVFGTQDDVVFTSNSPKAH